MQWTKNIEYPINAGGHDDIFFAKFNSNGEVEWSKSMGEYSQDNGFGIALNSDENILITGVFRGDVDFDPGPYTSPLTADAYGDIFFAKYKSNGESTLEYPRVILSTTINSPTNLSSIPIEAAFSHSVTGLDSVDITITNGTVSSIEVSETTYSINIIPTVDGTITVIIPSGVASNTDGLFNTSSNLLQIEYMGSAPGATITSVIDSITNISPIPLTITFNKPVTGFEVDDLTISPGFNIAEGSFSDFSGSGTTYTVNFTPSTDGWISITLPADVCTDAAGNSNVSSSMGVATLTFDSTGPTPLITYWGFTGSPNKQDSIYITVMWKHNIPLYGTGFEFINDMTGEHFTVTNATVKDYDSGSAWDEYIVCPIADGIVTFSIPDSVVTDYVGNYNFASEVYTFVSDRTPPTATISSSLTSPTMISPIPISITFSEPVRGFTADSISVENGSASNLTGSDIEYAFDITPTFTDTIKITFSEGSVTDSAYNNLIVDDFSIFYYTYPKVLSMTPDISTLTWKDKEFQFTISDRLDPATVTEDNITISSLHSSGLNPTYTYSDTSSILTINLESSFVAVDSVSITLKGTLTNTYGYGFDGDGDGTPGDDQSITFTTVMLGDYDKNDVLDLTDLASLVQGFRDKDYGYELAPFTGSAPHYTVSPDSSYDIEDLMAFGMTWNWQASLSRSLFRQWEDAGIDIAIETAHDLISMDIPAGTVAYEVQISYNPSHITIYSPENTGDINLRDNDEDSGIYTLLAMTEDKLAMPITISGREADIMLSFRAVGQDGEIISQLTRQLSLSAIPDNFSLSQAYPNPFNPITQIDYAIPEDVHVELIVYDILGRQVSELVNTSQQAGYHKVIWNGDQNASGLYFVKMVAGEYISTQKLMLVK